jgi:hypothetical protein
MFHRGTKRRFRDEHEADAKLRRPPAAEKELAGPVSKETPR